MKWLLLIGVLSLSILSMGCLTKDQKMGLIASSTSESCESFFVSYPDYVLPYSDIEESNRVLITYVPSDCKKRFVNFYIDNKCDNFRVCFIYFKNSILKKVK